MKTLSGTVAAVDGSAPSAAEIPKCALNILLKHALTALKTTGYLGNVLFCW